MFSPREEDVIKILSNNKKLTVEEICNNLFTPKNKPMEANISVGNTLRRIMLKCHYHELNWTIKKNKDTGVLKFYKEKKK